MLKTPRPFSPPSPPFLAAHNCSSQPQPYSPPALAWVLFKDGLGFRALSLGPVSGSPLCDILVLPIFLGFFSRKGGWDCLLSPRCCCHLFLQSLFAVITCLCPVVLPAINCSCYCRFWYLYSSGCLSGVSYCRQATLEPAMRGQLGECAIYAFSITRIPNL